MSAAQVAREVNAATLLAVMIESPEAVENAAGIAAVEGIDVLFIGINDLAEEMGLSGQLDHPRVVDAVAAVAKASASHGKHVRRRRHRRQRCCCAAISAWDCASSSAAMISPS